MSGNQLDPVVRIDPAIWQQMRPAPHRLRRPLVVGELPLPPELADEQWAGMSLAFWVADTVIASYARGGDVMPVLDQLVAECAAGHRPSTWPWPRMRVTDDDLDPSVVAVIGVVFAVVADGDLDDPGLSALFDRAARRLVDAAPMLGRGRATADRTATRSL